MHLNQLKDKAEQALPENHPFLVEFLEWEPTPDASFERLVDILEDWKRGIRDWSEVEDLITHLKE